MSGNWLFLSNVFRLLAERSLKRYFKFCFILMERLKSNTNDSFYNDKYMQLFPLFNAFDNAYDLKSGNKAQRKGNTKLLNQLFKQLISIKLHAWDVAIQNVYLNTTAEYTFIFPKGLSPFSKYTIEERIKYLGNAVTMMSTYPALASVYDEMNIFYQNILKARGIQEQKDGSVNDSIGDVMQKAYVLADEIYGVLGDFMSKHKSNPSQIEAYFPAFLLKQKRKSSNDNTDIYEIKIEKGNKAEGGFSFKISENLNFYNTGITDLEIYFVPDKNSPKPGNTIILTSQDIKTILISDYANQNDRFLIIENLTTDEEGEIEISMV